jgi:hypothetical protein
MGFQRGLAPIMAIGVISTMFYLISRLIISRIRKSSNTAAPEETRQAE